MLSSRRLVLISLAIILLAPLTACGNSSSLGEVFAPDPKLSQWTPTDIQAKLPEDFPLELQYPNAQLQEVEQGTSQPTAEPTAAATANPSGEKITRWTTPDSRDQLRDFYQNVFQRTGWRILEQATNEDDGTLVAQRQDLQVTVAIPNVEPSPAAPSTPATPSTTDSNGQTPGTEFAIRYVRNDSANAQPSPEATQAGGDTLSTASAQQFTDLDQAPAALQPYLQDLAKLGVLTSSAPSDSESQFRPSAVMSRGEFARWLVATNNRIYRDQPARQIRLVPDSTEPAFQDVARSDTAFPAIQGLAEAGYIPSSLTGESNTNAFRPNAPLTREELLLWKVPVDVRRILPTATADGVKQTWGFKDANRINPRALPAVLADHRNGDLSNIRRVFGSTLLFQPKKAVTRAEAVAALWYIGTQGEGFSAQEVLRGEQQASPAAAPSTAPSTADQPSN